MKKTRITALVLALLFIFTAFTACNKSKDNFKKDFNVIAQKNGLSQLPESMMLVSNNGGVKVESADIEPAITITTETQKNGFTSKITVQTQTTGNNWENYAKTLIELYIGANYKLDDKVKSLYIDESTQDFYIELPTTTKINENVTAYTLYAEDGTRTIEISRVDAK